MKQIFFGLLALTALSAQAQNADEIIQKYANAMGGLDNFNKVKTVKMTGTVTTQGMDLPITIQIVNGKAMRSDRVLTIASSDCSTASSSFASLMLTFCASLG